MNLGHLTSRGRPLKIMIHFRFYFLEIIFQKNSAGDAKILGSAIDKIQPIRPHEAPEAAHGRRLPNSGGRITPLDPGAGFTRTSWVGFSSP